nr:hypothetical protein [Nanoarchaeum sp.]
MVTFEQARREPELRQSYTEQVDLGEFAKYVKDVIYTPPRSETSQTTFMSTCRNRINAIFNIPTTKSTILVFPFAFENSKITTESDFINCLKYHEGTHAKQNFKASPTEFGASARYIKQYGLTDFIHHIDREFDKDVPLKFSKREKEIEAYARQLTAHSSGEAPISQSYELSVRGMLAYYSGIPQIRILEIFSPW